MKIILSRKGFDSENGGYPSPIMPGGKLVSLPIPSEDNNRYSHLMLNRAISYFDVMKQLNPTIKQYNHWTELTPDTHCHVDPDIFTDVLPRDVGWKAIFGQISAAQTHLSNMNVSVGDVFLFFGWFRRTTSANSKIIFDKTARDQHIIFGYLQIGQIIHLDEDIAIPDWMSSHPHLQYVDPTNTIYVAREKLSWNDKCSGWGSFSFHKDLVLTKEGPRYTRSQWDLPEIFKRVNISYHDQNSWKSDYFQSAGRGQEFVVDWTAELEKWTKCLIDRHARTLF